MNRWISDTVIFASGIGSGFLAGWLIRKNQNKKEKEALDKGWAELMSAREKEFTETKARMDKAEKDISDMEKQVEAYKKAKDQLRADVFKSYAAPPIDPDIKEPFPGLDKMSDIIKQKGYSAAFNGTQHLISDDEFGDGEYETVCLTYYVDGHLVRDDGIEVSVDDTIGSEALNHFTENDDLLYVRNDILHEDYEVLFSGEAFTEE